LRLRQEFPDVFAQGAYQKLEVEGPASAHVLGFLRQHKNQRVAVLVTRLAAGLVAELPLAPPAAWADTAAILPGRAWTDALNGGAVPDAAGMDVLFAKLPIALLKSP
jgi:(1->4)-alpha-D-glucan 1-alpha-D-glucosylmutase